MHRDKTRSAASDRHPHRKPPVSTYRVIWRECDHAEPLDHLVIAAGWEEARRISATSLRSALGPEFEFWRLQAVL